MSDTRPAAIALLANIKAKLPELKEILAKAAGEWTYEDGIYRYYHGSFKVFYLNKATAHIVDALRDLAPDRKLNKAFGRIVDKGLSQSFDMKRTNEHWDAETRPVMEAFFHARFMLEMAVKYGEKLEEPPSILSSGWAALLYLYGLR